jgi:hypothetical protein
MPARNCCLLSKTLGLTQDSLHDENINSVDTWRNRRSDFSKDTAQRRASARQFLGCNALSLVEAVYPWRGFPISKNLISAMFSLNLKQKRECQGILPKNGRPHHRGDKKTKIISFERPKC